MSKVAGGLAALARGLGDRAVLERALDQQRAIMPPRPIRPDAAAFVQAAAAALRSGSRQAAAD